MPWQLIKNLKIENRNKNGQFLHSLDCKTGSWVNGLQNGKCMIENSKRYMLAEQFQMSSMTKQTRILQSEWTN